jgi:hypothetical protein
MDPRGGGKRDGTSQIYISLCRDIAVADREVSLLMPMGPAGIGKQLSSRMLSQSPSKPQIGRLIKNAQR